MKSLTFVAACKDFFGLKKDQTSVDFLKEVRDLTPQDKDDLRSMLTTVGYTCTN